MAMMLAKALTRVPKRYFYTTAKRLVDEEGMPDDVDMAFGLRKKEILYYLEGKKDPYTVMAIDRNKDHAGTRSDPNLVPSAFESRIIGCICSEDSNTVLYIWLYQDEPKRCFCGHWFRLYYQAPFSEFDNPIPRY